MTDTVAADQLRLFIERIERLEEEKKGMADDIRDVYSEAKSQGYDSKTMRRIVQLRKMEKHARDEAALLSRPMRPRSACSSRSSERHEQAFRQRN
jgi:uncharacterized protein (UPF0335 family)